MDKIKVDKIFYNAENKAGIPYKDKKGNAYSMFVVYSGEQRFTVWDYDANYKGKKIVVGDVIEGEISESNGFFSITVKKETPQDKALGDIASRVLALEKVVFGGAPSIDPELDSLATTEPDEPEVDIDDIPF
jgi:hypothetical protein